MKVEFQKRARVAPLYYFEWKQNPSAVGGLRLEFRTNQMLGSRRQAAPGCERMPTLTIHANACRASIHDHRARATRSARAAASAIHLDV
jgi:hypothetical protein